MCLYALNRKYGIKKSSIGRKKHFPISSHFIFDSCIDCCIFPLTIQNDDFKNLPALTGNISLDSKFNRKHLLYFSDLFFSDYASDPTTGALRGGDSRFGQGWRESEFLKDHHLSSSPAPASKIHSVSFNAHSFVLII